MWQDRRTPPPLDDSQFEHLMRAIQDSKDLIDFKLAQFREEVRDSQERAAESAARKARRDPYNFKKRGNQEQFCVNESIDEALLQAEIELEATTSYSAATQEKLKNVGDCIAKGRQLIADTQKLIKIADRSDPGWAVVEEYTADELAADSDDEKRLDKAARSAEREAAKRRKHTLPTPIQLRS